MRIMNMQKTQGVRLVLVGHLEAEVLGCKLTPKTYLENFSVVVALLVLLVAVEVVQGDFKVPFSNTFSAVVLVLVALACGEVAAFKQASQFPLRKRSRERLDW
jgi:hypothetical protein